MSVLYALFLFVVLFLAELVYFRIADHYNIVDQPNHRSSHTAITIRGGGILFAIAALLSFFLFGFQYQFFTIGLFLITVISFLDDIHTLNNKVRLGIHGLSVLLLFMQLDLIYFPWYFTVIGAIVVIGTINAYNFMDGINGITGGYSLLLLGTLFYINSRVVTFTSTELLIMVMISLLVFNFFNFRTRARCFAGDVGSISIAFIVIFLIGQLIIQTQNFSYILLLLIYGLDTVTTIGFRLFRRENIFEAHRSHFYQYLVNEKKKSHLLVATCYGLVQLLINILLITFTPISPACMFAIVLITTCLFITLRFKLEGNERLLKQAGL